MNGDADAFAAFIRGWLKSQNRSSSPIFLAGESYGGTRMGLLVNRIPDLNVAGIILLSPGINLQIIAGDASEVTGDPEWNQGAEIDQSFVDSLPTYAVAAVVQSRVPRRGRTLEQVYQDARVFAQGPYAAALQEGAALPPQKRHDVAAKVAELVGLPVSAIESANLRVMSQTFLETLVPGKLVSRLDTRVAVPKRPPTLSAQDPNLPKSIDDPSIPWIDPADPRRAVVEAYMRSAGAPADVRFGMGNLPINMGWDWSSGSKKIEDNTVGLTVTPNIARFMRKHPVTRLYLATGYFDADIPSLTSEYSLLHVGVPTDRMTMKRYPTGHEIGEDDTGRHLLMSDLHSFIAQRE